MSVQRKSGQSSGLETGAMIELACGRFIAYASIGIGMEMFTPVAASPNGLIAGFGMAAAMDATLQGVRAARAFARSVAVQRHLCAGAVTLMLASDGAFQPRASRGGRYKAMVLAPQG